MPSLPIARLAICGWFAGCSFRLAEVPPTGDASGSGGGGSADAFVFHDAPPPPDAKIYRDGAAVTGSLVVTATQLGATDIGLTTEGTLDWAHWGLNNATTFDHELGGTAISNVTVIGGGTQLAVFNTAVTATWGNGTPDMSATQTGTGTGVACIARWASRATTRPRATTRGCATTRCSTRFTSRSSRAIAGSAVRLRRRRRVARLRARRHRVILFGLALGRADDAAPPTRAARRARRSRPTSRSSRATRDTLRALRRRAR